MAPKQQAVQAEETGNLLKVRVRPFGHLPRFAVSSDCTKASDPAMIHSQTLLSGIEELDLRDLDQPDDSDPGELLEPDFEISRLFAIVDFGLRHANDEDGLLSGLDM